MSPLSSKLVELYDTIKDHSDAWGRTLSTPFMRLPLKNVSTQMYERDQILPEILTHTR